MPFNATSKRRGAYGLCRCTSCLPSYGAAQEATRGTKDLRVRHFRRGERRSAPRSPKEAVQSAAWREKPSPHVNRAKPRGEAPHLPIPEWAAPKTPGMLGVVGSDRATALRCDASRKRTLRWSNRRAVQCNPQRMRGRQLAPMREPLPRLGRHVKPPEGPGTYVCVWEGGGSSHLPRDGGGGGGPVLASVRRRGCSPA